MKKVFTIEIDTDTHLMEIKSGDKTINPTGFILFCGNNDQCWTLHYGRYDTMVRSFYSALADPYFAGFAEELKRSTVQRVEPDEALAKFGADICDCTSECKCKKTKVFH